MQLEFPKSLEMGIERMQDSSFYVDDGGKV